MDRKFKGTITEVSYSPQLKNNILSYKAKVNVDNKDYSLRPGMTVNAKLSVAKSIDCLAITSQAFQINPKFLEKISKNLDYEFKPLDEKEKEKLEKENNKEYTTKFVWIVPNKSFVERTIKIGITDDNYFEVIEGLSKSDKVIIDVEEPDEMEALYKKLTKIGF